MIENTQTQLLLPSLPLSIFGIASLFLGSNSIGSGDTYMSQYYSMQTQHHVSIAAELDIHNYQFPQILKTNHSDIIFNFYDKLFTQSVDLPIEVSEAITNNFWDLF